MPILQIIKWVQNVFKCKLYDTAGIDIWINSLFILQIIQYGIKQYVIGQVLSNIEGWRQYGTRKKILAHGWIQDMWLEIDPTLRAYELDAMWSLFSYEIYGRYDLATSKHLNIIFQWCLTLIFAEKKADFGCRFWSINSCWYSFGWMRHELTISRLIFRK